MPITHVRGSRPFSHTVITISMTQDLNKAPKILENRLYTVLIDYPCMFKIIIIIFSLIQGRMQFLSLGG
jgi:hypothetical protein